MDSSAITNYGNLILAALTFGYAVWTKWSAKQQTAAANAKAAAADEKASTATEQASQAVDHSQAAGAAALVNSQALDVAKKQIDDLLAARLDIATFERRLDSNEKALLWLADHLGGFLEPAETPAPAEPPAEAAVETPRSEAAETTGRHRLPTTTVPTIPQEQP